MTFGPPASSIGQSSCRRSYKVALRLFHFDSIACVHAARRALCGGPGVPATGHRDWWFSAGAQRTAAYQLPRCWSGPNGYADTETPIVTLKERFPGIASAHFVEALMVRTESDRLSFALYICTYVKAVLREKTKKVRVNTTEGAIDGSFGLRLWNHSSYRSDHP